MTPKNAEIIAANAFTWMVAQDEIFLDFLQLSGCTAENIKEALNDPHFLSSVMEHLMSDDTLIISCAEALEITPEIFRRAAFTLGGAQNYDWA